MSEAQLLERGLAVKGRSKCILSSARLRDLGASMRPIDVALNDCIERYAVARGAGAR